MNIRAASAIILAIACLLGAEARAATPANAATMIVPRLPEVPTIDGVVNAREWNAASILPPLIDQASNGVRGGQHTRIYVGWNDANLFVAVQHHKPRSATILESSARSAAALKSSDHLELAFSGAHGGASLILWPKSVFVMQADQPLATGWNGKAQIVPDGWEAEIQLPIAQLGVDPKSLAGFHLEATLHRPSLGLSPSSLSADLTPIAQSVAIRFLEGGDFVGDVSQGTRVEIVNAGAEEAMLAMKVIFKSFEPGAGAPAMFEDPNFKLAANASRRIQLAQPLSGGQYGVDYAMTLSGKNGGATAGSFAFESGGALEIEVLPFFLWRGGIFVRATLPESAAQSTTQPSSANFAARLFDSSETKSLVEATASGPRPGTTELFLSTKDLKPGVYVIEVQAIDPANGQPIAAHKTRVTRPELPAWWKPRDTSLPPGSSR